MSTSTKMDLVVASMQKAGQLATGQNPAADEVEHVEAAIDRVLPALARLKVVYIPDDDEIDDAFMEDLATIVGESIIRTREPDVAAVERSQARLRKMQAPQMARRTLQIDPALRRRAGWPTR